MASEFLLLLIYAKINQIKISSYNFKRQQNIHIHINKKFEYNDIIPSKRNNFLPSNDRKPSLLTYYYNIDEIKLIFLKLLLSSVPHTILIEYLIQNYLVLLKIDNKFIINLNSKCKILYWIKFYPIIYDNIYRINYYESFGYTKKTNNTKGFNGENTTNTKRNNTKRKLLLSLLFNQEQFFKTPMDIFYNNYIHNDYYYQQYNEIYNNDFNEYNIIDKNNSDDFIYSEQQQQQRQKLQLQQNQQQKQQQLQYNQHFNFKLLSYFYVRINYKNCSENCNTELFCHRIHLDINSNININAAYIQNFICCIFIFYQFRFNEYNESTNLYVPISLLSLQSTSTSATTTTTNTNNSINKYSKYLFFITIIMFYILLAFKKFQLFTNAFSIYKFCPEQKQTSTKSNYVIKDQQYEFIQKFYYSTKSKFESTKGIQLLSKFCTNVEFINKNSNNSNNSNFYNNSRKKHSKFEKKFSCYIFNKLQKMLQFILPVFILFNMLPVLHAGM